MVSSALPPWEQFFTNLSRSCEARGEQSRLAELAGLARGQFARWLNRSLTPILESILEFCYVCNVTPLQILTGDLAPLRRIVVEGKPCRLPRAQRPVHPVDRGRCQELIQAVLEGRAEPLGPVQIAERLGCHSSTLRYHFPQESVLLSKQIKRYLRKPKQHHLSHLPEPTPTPYILL